MNQKKAKALRRECIDIPKMKQRILTGRLFRVFRNKKTGQIIRVLNKPIPSYEAAVNHYRNAKKLYRGSIKPAVRAAIRHAGVMESIGVYKFR